MNELSTIFSKTYQFPHEKKKYTQKLKPKRNRYTAFKRLSSNDNRKEQHKQKKSRNACAEH